VVNEMQKGCTHVVLTRGMYEKLGVPDATVKWLESKGIKVYVAETRKAVETYNALTQEGKKVGSVIHPTC
jgi:hypothetical protein